MFIISHPRSGTANLVKYLSFKLSEKNISRNLDEFFYTKNFQSWGEFSKIYHDSFNYNQQLTLFSLKENLDFEDKKSYHLFGKNRNLYLEKINLTFKNKTEAFDFYNKELNKRINFLKDLEKNQIEYVVKFFFESNRPKIDFPIDQSIVLYRRNMADSIYSSIIKFWYYNNNRMNDNFIDYYNSGINFLVPFYEIDISEQMFESFTYSQIELLKFIKSNPDFFCISYEDVYQTNKNLSIPYKSFEINLNRFSLGQKISYGCEKKEYFSNHNLFRELFFKIIKKNSLDDICEKYQIVFE